MLCISFEEFLPTGATRPFLSMAEDSRLYVVKAHGNPLGTKVLFNEYITGLLASEIDLSWPNVQIVQLSQGVIDKLEQSDFEVLSKWAVGIEYIRGLEEIKWPPNVKYSDPNFDELNAQYILKLFPDGRNHNAFYGKAVLDNWLLIEDTTYDTLHKTLDGKPMFLDASISFGGLEFDENKLNFRHIFFETSPYLCGFKFKMAKFEFWLKKIEKISVSTYNSILNGLPDEWDVPPEFIKYTKDYLLCTNKIFLKKFKEQIEFEELSKFL